MQAKSCVKLTNSMSEEHDVMRYWMLPQLMQTLQENTHNEYPQHIFESGTVFSIDDTPDTGVKEQSRIAEERARGAHGAPRERGCEAYYESVLPFT